MIPSHKEFMLPLLKFASDQKEHTLREAVDYLAREFKLSEEEKNQLLPSGQRSILSNRVGWAKTYLSKARLLSSPKRGVFRITEEGLKVLKNPPNVIDERYLLRYPSFQEFLSRTNRSQDSQSAHDKIINNEVLEQYTPEDLIASGYKKLRTTLVEELLDMILSSSPNFFEQLVIDLLVKIGYGGSREDAGKAIGKTNDEGIDGIIKEDTLGLDVIYIQAKRWSRDRAIGRPEIQKFVGALSGKKAKKGIFITTATFTKNAYDYASNIENKVVLIDGEQLANLMIDHGVGVTTIETYEIKKLDVDYFTDE